MPAAIGAVGTAVAANGVAFNLTPPAHNPGDQLFALIMVRNSSGTIASPGWTVLGPTSPPGNSRRVFLLTKVAGASEGASTFTPSGTAGTDGVGGFIFVGTGLDSTSLVHAESTHSTNASVDTTIEFNALNITGDGKLVLILWFHGSNNASAQTALAAQGFSNGGLAALVPGAATAGSIGFQYVVQTVEDDIEAGSLSITASTSSNSAWVIALNPASAVAPDWSVEPSITDTSAVGNTASFTADSSCTAYMGVYKKDSATPSAANLKAGAGTGFIAVFSKAVTGADTLTSTGLDFPIHDYHFILNNANGDSSIVSLTDVAKNPATGQQYRTFTTPLDGDTIYSAFADPAIVSGDIQDLPTLTANGNTITPAADGNDVIDSPDETRDYYDYRIYDVSAGDWMQFTGHPIHGDGDYGRIWWNNETPVATEIAPTTLLENVAMSVITLAAFVTDDDDSLEDLVLTVSPDTVDALPTGVSISTEDVTVGESTLTVASLEGTPTVVDSGVTTLRITDVTGAYVETDWEWSVVATSTVPDVDEPGTTEAAAVSAIEAENLVAQVFTAYSQTVPLGEVIGQSPIAGAVVAEGSVVTIEISRGYSAGPNCRAPFIGMRMGT
jgi:hypothetical protein